jgi:hypothetical protein
MPRKYTNLLIELAEEGAVNWQGIARECLQRMSEDEVKNMVIEMEWNDCVDNDEDEEDDEEADEDDIPQWMKDYVESRNL